MKFDVVDGQPGATELSLSLSLMRPPRATWMTPIIKGGDGREGEREKGKSRGVGALLPVLRLVVSRVLRFYATCSPA